MRHDRAELLETAAVVVAILSFAALLLTVPRWGLNTFVVVWGLYAIVCVALAWVLVWAERQ